MVADRDDLIRHLQDVGYYRLRGYWHIHKKHGSDEFWGGTTFKRVWDMYVFDRQFRLVVLDAVERVEVYMRTQLAYLHYQNNIYIQDDAPEDYVPRYRDALGEDEFKRCCREHALPESFESMDYEEFLAQRRVLMAQLVKDGFEKL